uniref:Metalloendopeptidase n=1 Tax=Acrobeloides nanus TaxID=290746 RepID=A0A914D8I9_9BILA
MKRIDRAMKEFHKRTCIRFIPKSSHQDYLYITQDKVCYSEEIGMKGGQQNVSLTEDCMRGGGIIHELMHAIGFYHEQSCRADRDSYVTIHLENVMDDAKANFETYDLEKITHLGAGYDYESIMHYDMKAFSKNGEPTIVPKKPGVTIGQRKGFSRMDVYKINKLYECRVINEGKENVDDTDVDFTDGAISADGANADALSKKITQGISSSCPTQYANKYIVGKTLIVIPGNLSDCCNYCKAAKGCKAYISDSNGQVVTGEKNQGIIKGSCPIGWRHYQPSNKCFYIGTKRINWFQAFNECFDKSGVLAFIDSEEESEFVASNFLKSNLLANCVHNALGIGIIFLILDAVFM